MDGYINTVYNCKKMQTISLPNNIILNHGVVRSRYRAMVQKDKSMAMIDCPPNLKPDSYFTLLWKGKSNIDQIRDCVNKLMDVDEDRIRSLFFFPNEKLNLPAYEIDKLPSPMEKEIIDNYGTPSFVRYEAYSNSVVKHEEELNNCSFSIWANLAYNSADDETETETEIGIFLSLSQWYKYQISSKIDIITSFLERTIYPNCGDDISQDFFRIFDSLLGCKNGIQLIDWIEKGIACSKDGELQLNHSDWERRAQSLLSVKTICEELVKEDRRIAENVNVEYMAITDLLPDHALRNIVARRKYEGIVLVRRYHPVFDSEQVDSSICHLVNNDDVQSKKLFASFFPMLSRGLEYFNRIISGFPLSANQQYSQPRPAEIESRFIEILKGT